MTSKARKNMYRLFVAVARILFDIFRAYFHIIEELLRLVIPEYRRPAILRDIVAEPSDISLDDRIRKIDAARENLQDAIRAVDDLREQASANKVELERALARIADAEKQKQQLDTQLDTLKKVAEVDTAEFRRVVGFPTQAQVWKERLFGFISGIIASIIASVLFLLAQHLFYAK